MGAGFSGLYAARQLEQANLGGTLEVQVVEARERVGGRVFSRRGFDSVLEEGGQLASTGYRRFVELAKELGIGMAGPPGSGERPRTLFFLGGSPWDTSPAGGAAASTQQLAEVERQLPPAALLSYYLGQGNPLEGLDDWRGGDHFDLDAISVAQLAEQRGASAKALELMDLAPNCNSIQEASALWALRDHHRRTSIPGELVVLPEGNGALAEKMAEQLVDPVQHGFVLEAIEQHEQTVTVIARDGRRIEADYVIVTLPFAVLRTITMNRPASGAQLAALRELPQTQITKVFLRAREPFWIEDGQPPGMWTDTRLERVFPLQRPDDGAVWGLLCWADGPNASALANLSAEEQATNVLDIMHSVRPTSRGKLEVLHSANWPTDPFALGAYHHFRTGQITAFAQEMSRPLGRLFFAGEHTSVEMPGMEGALESGERAAREVLQRIQAA